MAEKYAAEQERSPGSWETTGNHYLALPMIGRADGVIRGVNVVHRGLGGLVTWAAERDPDVSGPAFLRARIETGGAAHFPSALEWERIDRWIPRWRARITDELTVTGTICTPGGTDPLIRGGMVLLEVSNRGRQDVDVDVVLEGAWRHTLLTVATTRELTGSNRLVRGSGSTDGLAFEVSTTSATLALAVCADSASYMVSAEGEPSAALAPGEERVAPNGEQLAFEIRRSVRVRAERTANVAFYFGLGAERDGALATAAHHARLGADELLRLARLDLSRLVRRTHDSSLAAIMNRNLLFAYYAGIARALDDDRVYFVRSRSQLHGACAVFNEREALLWLLPALTAVDPYLAREALLRSFEQYSHRPGERLRYLDGAVLAPGFCLDQLCAFAVALDRYVTDAQDPSLLDEPLVQDVLREHDEFLFTRLDPEYFLCRTELLPSGDGAEYPFVAWDNALVWRFAEALPRLWRRRQGDPPPRFERGADEVAAALWQRCTVEVDGLRVIGYMSDLRGGVAVYDDPAGSLRLLPYLGFCDADDPIWSNTMDFLHSSRYPLYHPTARHPGFGTRSRPELASFATVCADLLTERRDAALGVLRGLTLDAGIAGESYDPATGRITAGPFSAPLAGFLAWAILAEAPAVSSRAHTRERQRA